MDRVYFVVFDGYGGVDVARYVVVYVYVYVVRRSELFIDFVGVFREVFRRIDEMFLWKVKREVRIRRWVRVV